MKLAIICPIGDLNRFGYQRVAQICLESWRGLGDLFLIHSSRSSIPFEIEARYIRDERTLLKIVEGQEYFDYRVIAHNMDIGLDEAKKSGYECAITVGVNWYVESNAADFIAEKCQRLIKSGALCDILYRRWQIKDRLFQADTKINGLLNLQAIEHHQTDIFLDNFILNDQRFIGGERGDYPDKNREAYVDAGLEMSDADFIDKQLHIRNYEDILPKRHGADFNFWIKYFNERRNKMILSPDALGPIGNKILSKHQVGSFGDRWL